MNMGDASGNSPGKAGAKDSAPAYSDLFPELNSMIVGENKVPAVLGTVAAPVGAIRSSTTTSVFRINVEEQRLMAATKKDDDAKQRRVVDEVVSKTNVAVDMSYTKDGTLCVVLTGKGRKPVEEAKALLMSKLQKQAEIEMVGIPKEHYPAIIGRGGETLKGIQTETATRVKIPAADDIAGVIRITGSIDGCGKARTMIQCISDVEANRARIKLPVLSAYHPLVSGHKNERIKAISKETGATIHVPPSSKAIDEIIITGEKKGVELAATKIKAIYDTLQVTCGELSASIKKSQHRFIVGPRGTYLEEVIRDFGVLVEIPPTEEESDVITLRGPQDKLVNALTRVFERANSMTADELEVPGWLHRLLIGKKGSTLTELTKPFPNCSVDFNEDENLVKIEGPPMEVAGLKQLLTAKRDEMVATLATAELRVDPALHSRIIGKQGSNISKIKEATNAQINFPRADAAENGDLIRLSGPKDGVKDAVAQIKELVRKLKDHTELKYKVEQRFHSLIIGSKGAQIKKMVAECGEVSLDVPKNKAESDEITISGDKAVVAKVKTYLDKLVKQLREDNFVMEVAIYKPFHGTVIGKAGATVNKIKDETGVRIDIPSPNDPSDLITLTGPKAKCEEARKKIVDIQNGVATIVSDKVRFADSLQFKVKTVVIPAIRQACGGVLITEGKGELELRGPKDDVAAARERLAAVASTFASGKVVDTVDVPKKHFRALVRQGATMEQIESDTGALVFVPPPSVKENALVTLIGNAETCAAAAKAVGDCITQLEDVMKETLEVPKKFHKEMLAKRSKFLNDVKDKTGVNVSIAKESESVKLEGSRTRMEEAVQMVKDFMADVEARVTVKIQIPARDHRVFFVNQGAEIKKITDTCNVSIKIPDRRGNNNKGGRKPRQPAKADAAAAADPAADADADAASPVEEKKDAAQEKKNTEDTITIVGTPANCAAAEAALRELLPIEETLEVDPGLHRFIIGKGGEAVRKFMAEHNVNVNFGKNEDPMIRIRGDKTKVGAAVTALMARVVELDAMKSDLEAKSFKVELSINPQFHVKLIGKQGANVNKLRDDFGVDINFPDRRKKLSVADAKKVTVTGYEEAAKKAADHIMGLVEELQSMVLISLELHSGCHSKIIGRGGASIKALQNKHKVRVMMPREDGGPVKIEGPEKAALDCKDDLLEIEEEWRQEAEDYDDEDDTSMYTKPSRYEEREKPQKETKKAFKVKDAPWEKPPDTGDASSFPGLGGGGGGGGAGAANGGVWSRPTGGR